MHRKEQLLQNMQNWLDLDLPETCTALDNFSSINIKRVERRIELNQKIRGKSVPLGYAVLNEEGTLNGMIIPNNSTPIVSFILFGLEKAVESN